MPAPIQDRQVGAQPAWVAAMDGILDGSLLAFAGWTVWYEIALWTQTSLWWPVRIWAILSVVLVAACARREIRRAATPLSPEGREEVAPKAARLADRLPLLAALATTRAQVALGVLLAVLVAVRGTLGVVPIALVAIVLLLIGLSRQRVKRSEDDPASSVDRAPVSRLEHALAGALSLALAGFASLVNNPDGDDAFYVNRATWVAEHGVPVVKDTMFSPGTLPSAYIGGLPLPSIEALQGALAHVVHVEAATMAYLLVVPVMALGFGWTTWRLVRAWAPRQVLLVYAAALLFVLASGSSIVGNYSVARIWQGKVIAFAIVLPLVWFYFTRLVLRPTRWHLQLLFAAGVAFVGLTSTASLLTPVLVAAALLAAWMLRSRALAAGAALFLAVPLGAGVVLALGPAQIGGTDPVALPASEAFTLVMGADWAMIMLGLLGAVFAIRLLPGPVAVLAGCASLATMVALLPGVFELVNAATGAGPIAWRLLLGLPVWILVGMLLAVPLEPRRTPGRVLAPRGLVVARAGVAVALATVVLVAGTPIWSTDIGAVGMTSRPVWKVFPADLADLRAVSAERVGPGPWLLPPKQMELLSLSTTEHSPVVARDIYLPALLVGEQSRRDRNTLLLLAGGRRQSVARVRAALVRLDVAVACVQTEPPQARRVLTKAVGERLQHVGTLSCHIGPVQHP